MRYKKGSRLAKPNQHQKLRLKVLAILLVTTLGLVAPLLQTSAAHAATDATFINAYTIRANCDPKSSTSAAQCYFVWNGTGQEVYTNTNPVALMCGADTINYTGGGTTSNLIPNQSVFSPGGSATTSAYNRTYTERVTTSDTCGTIAAQTKNITVNETNKSIYLRSDSAGNLAPIVAGSAATWKKANMAGVAGMSSIWIQDTASSGSGCPSMLLQYSGGTFGLVVPYMPDSPVLNTATKNYRSIISSNGGQTVTSCYIMDSDGQRTKDDAVIGQLIGSQILAFRNFNASTSYYSTLWNEDNVVAVFQKPAFGPEANVTIPVDACKSPSVLVGKTCLQVSTTSSAGTSGTVNTCPLGNNAPMRWLGCSIMDGASTFMDLLYKAIQNFLYTPVDQIFNSTLLTSYNSIRNLALGLVLIAGLAMVIAQASGSDLVDAYTVRKLMPRLGVALVGIALSWPLLKFAVTLTNDLGLLADRLLATVSGTAAAGTNNDNAFLNIFNSLFLATSATVGVVAFLGPAGAISLVATVLLGMLVGLAVLAVRQLVIMVAVVLAPLAIAAYVLPGTQKLWSFWKNTLITTLAMFPLIMFFLSSGRTFSALLSSSNAGTMNLLAIVIYFAPYFMLPFAFKMAGGLMTTIFSMANDKNRSAFDRLRKGRQESGAQHRERTIGRQTLLARAKVARGLNTSASKDGVGRTRGRLYRGLAHGVGGYNIEGAMANKQAAINKEIFDIKDNGADGALRGTTVDLARIKREGGFEAVAARAAAGDQSADAKLEGGKRKYRSLGGAWVNEADVLEGKRRWGGDHFAQQSIISYEMSKAMEEDQVQRVSERYMGLAEGDLGMNRTEAEGAWIGPAFQNKAKHLEYKHTEFDADGTPHLKIGAYTKEMYENIGSYPAAGMSSNQIKRLTDAYNDPTTDEGSKDRISSIAETFMHEMGMGGSGQVVPGEDGMPAFVQPEYGPDATAAARSAGAGTGRTARQVSSAGSGHVSERIRELAAAVHLDVDQPRGNHADPPGNNKEQKF